MFGLYLGLSVYVMYGMEVSSLNSTNTEHQVFKESLIFSCAVLLQVVHVFSFPEKFSCSWRSMGIHSKCHQTISLVKAKKLISTINDKMATQHQVLPEAKNNLFPQKKIVMRCSNKYSLYTHKGCQQ